MRRRLIILGFLGVLVGVTGCTTPKSVSSGDLRGRGLAGKESGTVRTTAYTHTEADSLKYGRKNAAGTNLKYGRVRSAAADWSVYPVGTVFRIQGEPYLYEIDDYGSALVGTETIDLYKPSKGEMNRWGVRHVPIEILRFGCYERSLDILKDRTRHGHVRAMFNQIAKKG